MRKILSALSAAALLAAAGCATTDKNYAAALAATQAIASAQSQAQQERFRQMGTIAASSTDPAARAVAVMAMAMIQTPQVSVPPLPESEALKWASVVVPSLTSVGMGYFTYRLGATQSNNQRDVALSTNGAFASMGQSIATAGTYGYGFVQAPQPNVTTNNSFGRDGVVGGGTQSNNNSSTTTTTRNCPGGTGGAGGAGAPGGGTTTGAAGGAGAPGGAASGGTC